MRKQTERVIPLPIELMRMQIADHANGSRGAVLIDFTSEIFPVDSFTDWMQGIRDGQRK